MELIVIENDSKGKNVKTVERTALLGIIINDKKFIVVYCVETDNYGLMNSMLGIENDKWYDSILLILHHITKNHKVYYFENRLEHLTWLVS